MRLAWRNIVGGKRGRQRMIAIAILAVVFLIIGVPAGWALSKVNVPVNTLSVVAAGAASALVFTLMLSQALAAATEALYTRGDLDLLFSSPLAPRKILTVRFLALAASAFTAFALFISPVLLPAALFGHWAWLSIYVVLASLALAASGCGLAVAVGLFALIGPRRTRTVAQILAAIIGAIFFLGSQFRNLAGRPDLDDGLHPDRRHGRGPAPAPAGHRQLAAEGDDGPADPAAGHGGDGRGHLLPHRGHGSRAGSPPTPPPPRARTSAGCGPSRAPMRSSPAAPSGPPSPRSCACSGATPPCSPR